jgi:Holliday junction resolvase
MPNKNYLRGRRLEWQVKKDLERDGWIAVRTAGSHGHWDIIAFRDHVDRLLIRLIQCKATSSLSAAKRLVKEHRKKLPLRQFPNVQQELIIKITGTKSYISYPLES